MEAFKSDFAEVLCFFDDRNKNKMLLANFMYVCINIWLFTKDL